ncbi:hypothetical protein DMENIID0001_035080 [Sergentomyia squamirostris]
MPKFKTGTTRPTIWVVRFDGVAQKENLAYQDVQQVLPVSTRSLHQDQSQPSSSEALSVNQEMTSSQNPEVSDIQQSVVEAPQDVQQVLPVSTRSLHQDQSQPSSSEALSVNQEMTSSQNPEVSDIQQSVVEAPQDVQQVQPVSTRSLHQDQSQPSSSEALSVNQEMTSSQNPEVSDIQQSVVEAPQDVQQVQPVSTRSLHQDQSQPSSSEALSVNQEMSSSQNPEVSDIQQSVVEGLQQGPEDPSFTNPNYDDIGNWPKVITSNFRDYMTLRGTEKLQNVAETYPRDTFGERRSFNKSWYHQMKGGSKVQRTWLCYSPSQNKIHCFCCILFPVGKNNQFKNRDGFGTWDKLSARIKSHEDSNDHRESYRRWKQSQLALQGKGKRIDDELQKQYCALVEQSREILRRIVSAILFCAKQNLPLRGHDESRKADKNPGNFLAALEFLSDFDPLMKKRLQDAAGKKNVPSYLGHDVQNELIGIIASEIRKTILKKCKEAKFFGLILDTTTDMSRVCQLSEVLRYVVVEDGKVRVEEHFIDFIPMSSESAEALATTIMDKLEKDGIEIQDCRGQTYDNAATMSGTHSGVQKRILHINKKAKFIPCDNHSLNLVGRYAAERNHQGITFFDAIGALYNFFSPSSHRWAVLLEHTSAVKRHCDTRWSSKAEAVKAVQNGIDGIVAALEKLANSEAETAKTRVGAATNLKSIKSFEFLALLNLWAQILPHIERAQVALQSANIAIDKSTLLLENLCNILDKKRNSFCEQALGFATQKSHEWNINYSQKRIPRKPRYGGAKDAALNVKEETSRCMFEIIDEMKMQMGQRFEGIKYLKQTFSFLWKFRDLFLSEYSPTKEDVSDLGKKCIEFCAEYDDVTSSKDLCMDIVDALQLLKFEQQQRHENSRSGASGGDEFSPAGILAFLSSLGPDSYPSLCTALRIFLTIPSSVASAERSFSKLKLIKDFLRTTMGQQRLSDLAIISIEREIAVQINIDAIIDDFAQKKVRKI